MKELTINNINEILEKNDYFYNKHITNINYDIKKNILNIEIENLIAIIFESVDTLDLKEIFQNDSIGNINLDKIDSGWYFTTNQEEPLISLTCKAIFIKNN